MFGTRPPTADRIEEHLRGRTMTDVVLCFPYATYAEFSDWRRPRRHWIQYQTKGLVQEMFDPNLLTSVRWPDERVWDNNISKKHDIERWTPKSLHHYVRRGTGKKYVTYSFEDANEAMRFKLAFTGV